MSRCEFCKEGTLLTKTRQRTVPFEGADLQVEVEYSLCDSCGEVQITAEQEKRNRRAINEQKRGLLGIPSTLELRKMRARWRLTQSVAGKLLGIGPTAFSKYENGEVLPAAPTARLLYLLCTSDGAMRALVERFGNGLAIQQLQPVLTVASAISPQVISIAGSDLNIADFGIRSGVGDLVAVESSTFLGATMPNQPAIQFEADSHA